MQIAHLSDFLLDKYIPFKQSALKKNICLSSMWLVLLDLLMFQGFVYNLYLASAYSCSFICRLL